jgi:hypothetical protein
MCCAARRYVSNAARMRYEELRSEDLPIASGVIEGGVIEGGVIEGGVIEGAARNPSYCVLRSRKCGSPARDTR